MSPAAADFETPAPPKALSVSVTPQLEAYDPAIGPIVEGRIVRVDEVGEA